MKATARWLRTLCWALVAISVTAGNSQTPTPTKEGKNVGIASIPNLRDLGGYRTADGKTVASGLVYRSNQLSGISPADMEKLAGLGLKTALDLRTAEEREKRPEELPPGVKYVVVDVLADSPNAGPAQLEKLMADPKVANAELGGGKVEAAFQASYREFVALPSARREFGKLYQSLGDRKQVPALFHCTTGKDRTGWAAATFLTLMGVPKDKVYEDYLRSNDYILPAYQKLIDGFVAAGGNAEIPKAILGVKKEYLDAAFDEMQKRYGTIEKYFAEGLGISLAQQQMLRKLYLTNDGGSKPKAPQAGQAEPRDVEKTIAAEEFNSTSPYMGAPVEMVKAPNGAITNKKLLDRVGDFAWFEPTIENPAKGVWVFGGYGLAPMSIIEAEDGLIAFDTGDTKHDGELMLKAIRTVTKKPVKAIIYGHSHTVFGAAVIAEGNKDVMVIGHPNLNDTVRQNVGGGGAPSFFPEVGPYLTARALLQFNAYMPKEGPDAFVIPTTLAETDTSAFLPVNRPVKDGEEMTILGIKFQFFTKYGTDDKVHTLVWLPERKVVFNNLLWNAPPQLYSLRGDVFRDPREWIAGLKFMRDLNAETEVSSGSRPISGAKKVRETLEQYLDGASFVLDQSLRGILAGLGPDDLRHFVKFPKYLDDAPINLQAYGEISSYSPAIYYQTVGWYDNDAADLKPLAPADEARRLVSLMGGRDKVLAAAKAALDKKEYAWAAKLANQLYLIDNQDKDARQLKAEALRQMAYVATGANDRAHLMSQALALEGKTRIARLIPPPPEAIVATPTKFVDYFRVRIDPTKSDKTDMFVRFEFADGSKAGLHVRRAVAEFVSDPDTYYRKVDITLAMTGQTWAKLFLSQATAEDLIKNGEIKVTGSATEAANVINLFDRYQPEKAVVIPPAFLEHAP